MSIYSKVDSGVKCYRTMLPSRDRWCGTVDFFRLYGAQCRFLVPGDIWKEQVNCFIRLNPMLTPSLTPMKATIRWFYVPLRLVYDNTELTITGSKDGTVSSETLPSAPSILSNITDVAWNDNNGVIYVAKDSIAHVIFELPVGAIAKARVSDKVLPRLYWLKAYCRIWWDYYRDENLSILLITTNASEDTQTATARYSVNDSDFDDFFLFVSRTFFRLRCLPICLPKDYFTSSLPWQLKGVAPSIQMNVASSLTWNGTDSSDFYSNTAPVGFSATHPSGSNPMFTHNGALSDQQIDLVDSNVQQFLDNINIGNISGTFNVSDIRDMFAQTRVFERLARTGSRYIEYLRANFGIAPSDGTLQRAQYLGGFKQDILTTEVLQTGGDPNGTSTPVGTMRGHGISSATNSMKPFVNKEFGMLFTTFEIKPRIQYTQGIRRELSYGSRYDFFNPSFQRLSEQEVRTGEIFYGGQLTTNDNTFGFQGMYNELRSGKERFFGEMLDTQAQWNQAIQFTSQPNLNGAFINGTSYASSFLRPFGLSAESESTKPVIVDFYASNSPLRPMIRNPTPGLIDHN